MQDFMLYMGGTARDDIDETAIMAAVVNVVKDADGIRQGRFAFNSINCHFTRDETEEVDISAAFRRFVLQRHEDVTGVSGEGVVAEGVQFSNGVIALRWLSEFPTSVVFHDRGVDSVEAVHCHGGKTQMVFID